MSTVLLFTLIATLSSASHGSYFDVVVPKGKDFSFTCPFKVMDTELLTISKSNVTNYHIGGSTTSENPLTVYNTSTAGLPVDLVNTGRYTALSDEKKYYTIYISKVQPEDSGTWRCQVKNEKGDIQSGSYEKLIVLGADVNLAFQRRISRTRVDVYADELEINLTESQLKTIAFVVNVSGLMAVKPNASITSCYEDGSSHNVTSSFFHSADVKHNIHDGFVTAETVERFGGRSHVYTGEFTKTKGRVTLEGIYQYADRIFTRSILVKIIAPPIINPDRMELVFDVLEDTVTISTHVVAHPRVSSIVLRLQGHVVNFTDLYNYNVSHKDNVTVSILKAEGKFYNWYNLTIKYKADLMPGFNAGNKITVENSEGSDTYNFYLNRQLTSQSTFTMSSSTLLYAIVLLQASWF